MKMKYYSDTNHVYQNGGSGTDGYAIRVYYETANHGRTKVYYYAEVDYNERYMFASDEKKQLIATLLAVDVNDIAPVVLGWSSCPGNDYQETAAYDFAAPLIEVDGNYKFC